MAHLSSELLDLLAKNPLRKDVAYKKGEVIFSPLSEGSVCNIVISGFARVYTIDKQGATIVHNFCSTGDIVPVSWIIGKPSVGAFLDAMTNCLVAQMPQTELARIVATDGKAASLILKQITAQLFVYATLVGNLGFKYGRERLAYRLLYLAYRFGEQASDGTVLLRGFSQQDIGATINMSRETTNRELSKLEHAGAIAHRKGCIVILDSSILRREIGDENDKFYFDG